MNGDAVEALEGAVELLVVLAGRLADALPAVGRLVADVERDWPDERGVEWAERASLVRRVLQRELDAAAVAAHLLLGILDDERATDDAEPRPALPTGFGEGRPVPGGARSGGPRLGGPRLGGTDADRVDDERGVRIAELGDQDAEPG